MAVGVDVDMPLERARALGVGDRRSRCAQSSVLVRGEADDVVRVAVPQEVDLVELELGVLASGRARRSG